MKRAWTALEILLLLLAGTVFHSGYIAALTGEVTALLTKAETCAEQGDWASALEKTNNAQMIWESRDAYLHFTLRHTDTDGVHMGFREVDRLLQHQDGSKYAAANADLITRLELLSEAEQLTIQNIL